MIDKEKFIQLSRNVHGDKYDYSKVEYNKVVDKVCIVCPIHGEFWQSARQHYKGQGCPKCGIESRSEKKSDTVESLKEKFIKKFGDKYDLSLITTYTDSKTKVPLICHEKNEDGTEHGVFYIAPNYLLLGQGCPVCGNLKKGQDRKLSQEDVEKRIKELFPNYDVSKLEYKGTQTKVTVGCPKHGYFKITPDSLFNGCGCSKCGNERAAIKQTKTTEEFITEAKAKHKDYYSYEKTVYVNHNTPVTITCPVHGDFQQKPFDHLSGCGCRLCRATVSNLEIEIYDFIKSIYHGKIIKNCRSLIKGRELDIVIPDKKLAIEFDGLFWHCEKNIKDRNYHLDKTKKCAGAGYQLIHIFEDEWVYKKDICKSRIRNLLGVNKEKHYARKCTVRQLTKEESTSFFKQNHIQGNVGGTVCLGLFDGDRLVSAMSFSELRKNLGCEKQENTFELLRFANKLNTSVCGGASKLFKYFIETYKPEKVISYADKRWSIGKLYETLGFHLSHESRPSYFYVFGDTRKNRFGYRKDVLIKKYGCKPEETEHEFCLSKKWYRIYDCGTMVYIWAK